MDGHRVHIASNKAGRNPAHRCLRIAWGSYGLEKIHLLAASALLLAVPAEAPDDFDATQISEVEAINCKLDVPDYLAFALGLEEDGIVRSRGWKKIKSGNGFMDEYELPESIVVEGSHSTRRIAFTSDSILTVLDVPDPATVAA